MGIAQMEEIVTTVKAILKTLECPICLDLLKTPVSAGCGHFFCRECVSGILQSTYRAPCPLCKRSFTRRSIQEASQRQSVISAAQILANTCTNLTEVQFYANDSGFKVNKKANPDSSAPPKKLKTSKPENQDTSSRKRKSFENEGNLKTPDIQNASEKEFVSATSTKAYSVKTTEKKTEKRNKCKEMSENLADDYISPNKRVCPDSDDDDDSEDLPRLEDIFSEMAKSRKSSSISKKNEKSVEKPLTIFPADKASTIKTYSSAHRKMQKSNLSRTSSDDASKCKITLSDKDDDILMEEAEKNKTITDSPVKNIISNVQAKNKTNALKNKTNEVQSDASVIENVSSVKVKNGNKMVKTDVGNKSKENAPSPKAKKVIVLRRKSQIKLQKSNAKSSNHSSDEISLKENVVSNEDISNKKDPSSPAKKSNTKDCYTLNQVSLLHSETVKENEDCPKKQADDPSKLSGFTDTAVCVDPVASPLGIKNLTLDKSPGWSRVRKVKKDFKMKNFTSLHVEKNSPNVSNKSTVTSEQETISTIDKSDNSVDATIRNRNEDNSLDSENEGVMDIDKDAVLVAEKETNEVNGNGVLDNNRSSLVSKKMDDRKSVSVMNDTEKTNMNFEKMDCYEDVDNECITAEPECHVENNTNCNDPLGVRIIPSVSITSNSLICTKFADDSDKISSHNVLKSQKIVCELNPTRNNDLVSQNGNFISNCFNKKESKKLFSNPSNLKQAPFSLPTPFTDYQSFHTQSVENDHNFQYVEQSQQTSQVFNLDFQNAFCDKMRAVAPHQPPLLICPNPEKTKVVKRTCLTLEEIQDCFIKSSQSGSSETLCSVPFFSGLFKLHIGVADETLNVSVLKVLDPASEINNPSTAVSVLSDKSIQASSGLFPQNEVVPSSNAESESSQPDSAVDPFPYLNKESATNLVEKPVQVNSEFPDENSMPLTEPNPINKTVAMHDESVILIAEPSPKNNVPVEMENKDDSDDNCMNEDNLDMSEIIHFPSNPAAKDNLDKETSNSPKLVPEIDTCKEPLQETNNVFNECPVVLGEISSEKAAESLPESANKNQPLSDANNISFENTLAKCKKSSDGDLFNKTNISSKSEQISFDKSSSSDEDESLKKLQKCIRKERPPAEKKKISRLSLKKKSSFKRIQVDESSDESDSETSLTRKDISKKVEKDVFAKPENPPKIPSIEESFSSLRELKLGHDSKKNLLSSSTAEMPSTLSSIISEDASEANASDIILEIEDLSDKIKSLEERLKLCGHGENKHNRGDSDSEDSIDLFPQSVPPTPPNKM